MSADPVKPGMKFLPPFDEVSPFDPAVTIFSRLMAVEDSFFQAAIAAVDALAKDHIYPVPAQYKKPENAPVDDGASLAGRAKLLKEKVGTIQTSGEEADKEMVQRTVAELGQSVGIYEGQYRPDFHRIQLPIMKLHYDRSGKVFDQDALDKQDGYFPHLSIYKIENGRYFPFVRTWGH